MKRLHYKQELMYLDRVANYLNSLGYEVEAPDPQYRDLLDVWGKHKGKKCFVEIYVCMYPCDAKGINGIWHQGEHDGVEIFWCRELDELDTRNCIETILDGLRPLKRGAIK